MKKQTAFRGDVNREQYRREPEDRLQNRPTFDPFTGRIVFPMNFFELR